MGVKANEELLYKVAWLFANNKVEKDMMKRAALIYAESLKKARDSRDRWKLKKRLNNGQ